ncbi:MAG TPA: sigma-70 family RNA polymerase sigma factor [Haliscomenobacter sp.]|uniref:RNA polymerase sigma factor n=1 Tax=Haliscomenobacter sp. TaxID=2717303 RepID=UPI002C0B9C8A|nr:sigma-70 family RNA polymerase sigma factor [Haliscomenobacter sp.]HOY20690.1 sigma-70 family RNA polymerase sigma factor [Haliscomenobacter sp.]
MGVSDKELLAQISSGDSTIINNALTYLFEETGLLEIAILYASRFELNTSETEEIVQDSLLTFINKAQNGQLPENGSLRTYFLAIVKSKTFSIKKRKNILYGPITDEENIDNPEIERKILLDQAIQELGEECRKYLQLYMLSTPIKEIAKEQNMSEDYVKQKMFSCRQKLYKIIRNNPKFFQLLNSVEN